MSETEELNAMNERHEERMAAIRLRLQQSLDDPRPNLTSTEMCKRLQALYARYQQTTADRR